MNSFIRLQEKDGCFAEFRPVVRRKQFAREVAWKELQLIRGPWKLILGSLYTYLVDNYEVNKSWCIMHLRYSEVYCLRKITIEFF